MAAATVSTRSLRRAVAGNQIRQWIPRSLVNGDGRVTVAVVVNRMAWNWNGRVTSSSSSGSSRVHTHQSRLSSSSSRPDDEGRPPLPVQFLEAHDGSRIDRSTYQRKDVPFDPIDGKPPPPASSSSSYPMGEIDEVSWKFITELDHWRLTTTRNGKRHMCDYPEDWINSQWERWRADANDFDSPWSSDDASNAEKKDTSKRVLWSNWTESMVRDPEKSPILFQYHNVVKDKDESKKSQNKEEEERLLKALHQYGLVLITGMPIHTDSLPSDVMSETTKAAHAKKSNDSTESADSAILKLASMIGYHPLQTLYGSGVWSTSSQSSFYNDDKGSGKAEDSAAAGGGTDAVDSASASTADSAYGSTSLPLHTDMTYMSNPPGVQIFLMVQPAEATTSSTEVQQRLTSGNDGNNSAIAAPKGQSVYLDGFAAARQLLSENPDAFRILASTPRSYRCIDDKEGWALVATGPLIETVPGGVVGEWGPVKSIRHNDLDRMPDLPPTYYSANDDADDGDSAAAILRDDDTFYRKLREAHEAWDDILRRDSMRLVIDLKPGDCMLVANQRCLHGRYAFEASAFPRVVMGCYVGSDELASKWRWQGIDVL